MGKKRTDSYERETNVTIDIAVIDGDYFNRQMVREIVKNFGQIYFMEVFDGRKAIDLINNGIFDTLNLCFINLSIRYNSSILVVEQLKLQNPKVKVIALTRNKETLEELEPYGFDGIIRLGIKSTFKKIVEEIDLLVNK